MFSLSNDDADAELIEGIKNGDLNAHYKLCIRYMPLAKRLCGKFLRRFNYMKDDLLGAAYVGLTQAVTWIHDDNRFMGKNAGGYINCTIYRFIWEEVERGFVIPVPRSVFRKAKKDGTNVDECLIPKHINIDKVPPILVNTQYLFETIDQIQYYCDTKKEEQVLTMRVLGYTYEEIGTKFNQTPAAAHVTITRLRKKIKEKILNDN